MKVIPFQYDNRKRGYGTPAPKTVVVKGSLPSPIPIPATLGGVTSVKSVKGISDVYANTIKVQEDSQKSSILGVKCLFMITVLIKF